MPVALAPVRALVSTWVGAVVLTMLAYTVTASSPALGDTSWRDSARLGASLWALALGAPLDLPDARISLIPLALTVAIAWLAYRMLRSVGVGTWNDVGVAAGSAFVTTAILGLSMHPGTAWLLCAATAALLVGLAAAAGMRSERPAEGRVWDALRSARSALASILLVLLAAAALLLAAALVLGRSRIATIYGYYMAGAAGVVTLTLVQLLYLPTFLVWALAYASGSGFAVGQGTDFSAFGSHTQPLPAIPVFGALPPTGTRAAWLVIVLLVLSFGLGVRRSRGCEAGRAAVLAVTVTGLLFVGALAAGIVSHGSIGPGRMSETGPRPVAFAAAVALEIGLPFALGALARHGLALVRRARSADGGSGGARQATAPGTGETGEGEADDQRGGEDLSPSREGPVKG